MIWWVYCVSPSVCLCVVVQACNHPSMYSTIMSSSACNLCTMESCYCYCWCWCWCRWLICHTCRHASTRARSPAGLTVETTAKPWHGQACRRRCGQKLLSCWYSIPFSNRVVAVKLYSICLVFYKRALQQNVTSSVSIHPEIRLYVIFRCTLFKRL